LKAVLMRVRWAAIMVIRTVLNYLLQKEIEREQTPPASEGDTSSV
jgi:uncharacterized membrane protein